MLPAKGMVEVISSLKPDGTPILYDIRNGVWVCFEGDTDYVRNCYVEYKVMTDFDRPLCRELQALAPHWP